MTDDLSVSARILDSLSDAELLQELNATLSRRRPPATDAEKQSAADSTQAASDDAFYAQMYPATQHPAMGPRPIRTADPDDARTSE